MKNFILSLIVLFASFHSQSAQNSQRPVPTLTLKPVQGNVQIVDGGLGNMTLLVSGNELLVVDTKAEEAGVPIEELLKSQLSGKTLKYIINTHTHWDHTGNNKRLAGNATIIAHKNARRGLEKKGAEAEVGWPNLTFDAEMSLYFGGEEIRLIHYPLSHTNHDIVVYFTKSNVIAMGDMYFSGMYPFIATGGTLSGLIANLKTIIDMLPTDVKIVPGHGPISTLSDLKATHAMLVGTSQYIKQQIDAGQSIDDVKKAGLPSWTPTWGKGFCNEVCWIETLYNLLKP